ncbi:MAG: hypothetical protein AABN95_00390 [Acidobacteriota bacterium]
MNLRFLISTIFVCMFMVCAVTTISAQTFDISSGGQPTITGSLGGSVTGSANVRNDLVVTINFGEVSPANTNSLVKVVVPIAIRSTQPYRVSVSLAGSGNANPQGLQPSDIGFGAANIRAMGNQSQVCTLSSHIFYPPFNNDPASTVTIAANGRATYQSSLSNITGSTVILSGPRLQKSNNPVRQANDGYIFDAIFAITPQFFAAGTSSATLTFTISAGPNVPC